MSAQDWAPWISGAFTTLAVVLTVGLTAFFQGKRENTLYARSQEDRKTAEKRESIRALVDSMEDVLFHATLLVDKYKVVETVDGMPKVYSGERWEALGKAVNHAKIKMAVVHDDRVRTLAAMFLEQAREVVELVNESSPKDDITASLTALTHRFASCSEECRIHLYQKL